MLVNYIEDCTLRRTDRHLFPNIDSPAKHNYAFIPSTHDNQETLRKPGEVFANPKAALLGFPVVVERLQSDAVRLQIALDPAPDQLVAALIRKPPADVGNARLIFSYLSSQVSSE